MSVSGPQPPPWFKSFAEQVRKANEVLRIGVLPQARQLRQMSELARSARQQYESIVKPAMRQAIQAHEVWKASLPENWRELSPDQLNATLELVEGSRLCLVWVPRPTLITQLLDAAGPEDRDCLITTHRSEVIDDLERAVSEIGPDADALYADPLVTAREAIGAARDGHFVPAQTAAAAGLTAVLHEVFGFPEMGGLKKARDKFEGRNLDEVGIRMLKVSLIELCTAKALRRTSEAGPGFNRHGTQHGMRRFLSEADSLTGLMLLVAWVRELWWFQQHYPEVFQNEA